MKLKIQLLTIFLLSQLSASAPDKLTQDQDALSPSRTLTQSNTSVQLSQKRTASGELTSPLEPVANKKRRTGAESSVKLFSNNGSSNSSSSSSSLYPSETGQKQEQSLYDLNQKILELFQENREIRENLALFKERFDEFLAKGEKTESTPSSDLHQKNRALFQKIQEAKDHLALLQEQVAKLLAKGGTTESTPSYIS